MKDHNGDRFFLVDYKCSECDGFQEIYSESLAYWIDHPVRPGDEVRV